MWVHATSGGIAGLAADANDLSPPNPISLEDTGLRQMRIPGDPPIRMKDLNVLAIALAPWAQARDQDPAALGRINRKMQRDEKVDAFVFAATVVPARGAKIALSLRITPDQDDVRAQRDRIRKMAFGGGKMGLFTAMEFRQDGEAGGAQKKADARNERAQNASQKCSAALATATSRTPITMPTNVSLEGSNPGNMARSLAQMAPDANAVKKRRPRRTRGRRS